MLIEADTDQATLREYKKMKNPEDVASYRDAHAQEFGEEKIPTPVSEKVGKINSQIELVLRSHTTWYCHREGRDRRIAEQTAGGF